MLLLPQGILYGVCNLPCHWRGKPCGCTLEACHHSTYIRQLPAHILFPEHMAVLRLQPCMCMILGVYYKLVLKGAPGINR